MSLFSSVWGQITLSFFAESV